MKTRLFLVFILVLALTISPVRGVNAQDSGPEATPPLP